ncbi:hypothetical protein PIB30_080055 [Stylosanthes scabra]|uniref:Uncharacterized protein n=1 Tax=Stylosanthes scabra TaxID=79078 RepID=A0ABU6SS55_9FABA|nr:hypothetical protein [Stylosanthes scabra]
MAKYGATFSKVKPLVDTGVVMEQEKKTSSSSKHATAVKVVEEADAKHRQAVEASSRLNKRQEELKLTFRSFLN